MYIHMYIHKGVSQGCTATRSLVHTHTHTNTHPHIHTHTHTHREVSQAPSLRDESCCSGPIIADTDTGTVW